MLLSAVHICLSYIVFMTSDRVCRKSDQIHLNEVRLSYLLRMKIKEGGGGVRFCPKFVGPTAFLQVY